VTDNQNWLSKKYYAYRLLTNMWFVGAVWLYFYRLYITDQQVGILDGMAFAIGLIAEVPSGALADKFGRDKVARLGQILAGTGLLIQAAGSSFMPFFVGQSIMMIGVSFASGADEALFFENIKFKRDSVDWRKLVTRGSQFALTGSLVATVGGGWLHTINPRIPWILTGVSFILSAFIIWPVVDTRAKAARQKFTVELKDYLRDIKTGFGQFRRPALSLYVPLIVTVQGLFYTLGWGLLRIVLLDRFTFSPLLGSIVVAISIITTVWLLGYLHKHAERLSEKKVLSIMALGAAASLLLSVANIGLWGFVVILALYAGEHTLYPFMSEILNNSAPEKQRATVLSVGTFLRSVPYVALAPIIGALNTNDKLEYFLITWSLLILVALSVYLARKIRDEQIKFSDGSITGN
jgi:MFS family permease